MIEYVLTGDDLPVEARQKLLTFGAPVSRGDTIRLPEQPGAWQVVDVKHYPSEVGAGTSVIVVKAKKNAAHIPPRKHLLKVLGGLERLRENGEGRFAEYRTKASGPNRAWVEDFDTTIARCEKIIDGLLGEGGGAE